MEATGIMPQEPPQDTPWTTFLLFYPLDMDSICPGSLDVSHGMDHRTALAVSVESTTTRSRHVHVEALIRAFALE